MPRAPSTGFLMRADRVLKAVVPDPYDASIDGRGARYIVTDACVFIVPCGACGAQIGKPCLTHAGHAAASTHVVRRELAKSWKRRWRSTWAELVEGAAVSVRLALKLLEGLPKPCLSCDGTGARKNQSGYHEPCEFCDSTGVAPEDDSGD